MLSPDPEPLYADSEVVVASKPSGMLVHNSTWAGPQERCLLDVVKGEDGARLSPVHRIDRGTSGVVVLARTPEAARAWQEALAAPAAQKRYLALVRGEVRGPAVVDHPLKDERGVARDARSAVTPLVTSAEPRCSLVEVQLFTGRQHQARRHLKHLSHPVLGDATHGKGPLNREYAARFGLRRLALHAWRLSVMHPTSGAPLTFVAPLPDDLRAPLQTIFGAAVVDAALEDAARRPR